MVSQAQIPDPQQALMPVPLPTLSPQPSSAINPASMAPPKPRFCKYSAAKLKTLLATDKLARADLIADGVTAESYHTEPATAEYAVVKLRLLTATHHMRGSSGAVGAWALSQFGEDVETEGLSWGELDYGFHQWRRRATSFAPTFGQILGVIQKGKSQAGGPGIVFAKTYQTRIKRVLGVREAQEERRQPHAPSVNILRRRLGPRGLAKALEGVEATILRWQLERDANYGNQPDLVDAHPPLSPEEITTEWTQISDIMLAGQNRVAEKLRRRIRGFKAGYDPYDDNPYFDGVPQEPEPNY